MVNESARALLWQLEGLAKTLPRPDHIAHTLAEGTLGPAGALALEAGLQKLQRFPLSTHMLRETQAIMLGSTTVPHMQVKTQHALENLVHKIHESSHDPLVITGFAIAQFRMLAPFHDGNKRMLTILVALLLQHFELLSQPFLLLIGIGDGAADSFGQQVVECAIKTQQQIKALLARRQQHKEFLMKQHAPLRALQVLEFMQLQPSVRVQDIASELCVPYQSAANLIAQLEKFKLVKEVTGQKRERRFVYEALRTNQ